MINKDVKKHIRKDIRTYNTQLIKNIKEENNGMKNLRSICKRRQRQCQITNEPHKSRLLLSISFNKSKIVIITTKIELKGAFTIPLFIIKLMK